MQRRKVCAPTVAGQDASTGGRRHRGHPRAIEDLQAGACEGFCVVGDVHLPSATFFDLGVFAAVVGAVLLILTALAHQSLRALRAQEADDAKADAHPERP